MPRFTSCLRLENVRFATEDGDTIRERGKTRTHRTGKLCLIISSEKPCLCLCNIDRHTADGVLQAHSMHLPPLPVGATEVEASVGAYRVVLTTCY